MGFLTLNHKQKTPLHLLRLLSEADLMEVPFCMVIARFVAIIRRFVIRGNQERVTVHTNDDRQWNVLQS